MAAIENLIAGLTDKGVPVKPMPHPFVSFLKWTSGAVAYLAVLIAFEGFRGDIMVKLNAPLFAGELGLLAMVILASAMSISLLSFPDLYQKRLLAYTPLFMLVLVCGVLGLEWIQDTPPSPKPDHDGIDCLKCIIFSSLIPSALVFYRLRKTVNTHPLLAGSVALLSAASIGCLALRLSEPTDSIAHIVEWHYLPMLACGILGLILGKKFLKW